MFYYLSAYKCEMVVDRLRMISVTSAIVLVHAGYNGEFIRSLIFIQAMTNICLFFAEEEFPDSADMSVERNNTPGQGLIKAL